MPSKSTIITDADADTLESLSDELQTNEDFCSGFASRHAQDLIAVALGGCFRDVRERVVASWVHAVEDKLKEAREP